MASSAVAAFVWNDTGGRKLIFLSDVVVVALLFVSYIRLRSDYRLARADLEERERGLIDLLDGRPRTSQNLIAPPDGGKTPKFSIDREVDLLMWAAGVVIVKALVVAFRLV